MVHRSHNLIFLSVPLWTAHFELWYMIHFFISCVDWLGCDRLLPVKAQYEIALNPNGGDFVMSICPLPHSITRPDKGRRERKHYRMLFVGKDTVDT